MPKRRFTTYIDEGQLNALKKIYEKKRVTVTALLGIAIDRFLLETDWIDGPQTPPIEVSYFLKNPDDD